MTTWITIILAVIVIAFIFIRKKNKLEIDDYDSAIHSESEIERLKRLSAVLKDENASEEEILKAHEELKTIFIDKKTN